MKCAFAKSGTSSSALSKGVFTSQVPWTMTAGLRCGTPCGNRRRDRSPRPGTCSRRTQAQGARRSSLRGRGGARSEPRARDAPEPQSSNGRSSRVGRSMAVAVGATRARRARLEVALRTRARRFPAGQVRHPVARSSTRRGVAERRGRGSRRHRKRTVARFPRSRVGHLHGRRARPRPHSRSPARSAASRPPSGTCPASRGASARPPSHALRSERSNAARTCRTFWFPGPPCP
jgi:hypothetical protein